VRSAVYLIEPRDRQKLVIPVSPPRHSREGGNPSGLSAATELKNVTPRQACTRQWIPAFARMTVAGMRHSLARGNPF
jgi:hypothetical protein